MSNFLKLKQIAEGTVRPVGLGVDHRAGFCHKSISAMRPLVGFSRDISTAGPVGLMKGLGTRPLHWDYSLTKKTLNIASTDAADDLNGTGARQLRLKIVTTTGCITGWAQLQGTTPVSVKTTPGGSTDAQGLNINELEVFEVGSGKSNAGIIYVSNDAGGSWTAGVPPNIQGVIEIGDNVAQLGHFQIPGDKVGYLVQVNSNTDIPTSNEIQVDALFRISSADVNRQLNQIRFSAAINGSNVMNIPLPTSSKMLPLAGLTLQAFKITGGGSHIINAIAHVVLQDKDFAI